MEFLGHVLRGIKYALWIKTEDKHRTRIFHTACTPYPGGQETLRRGIYLRRAWEDTSQ